MPAQRVAYLLAGLCVALAAVICAEAVEPPLGMTTTATSSAPRLAIAAEPEPPLALPALSSDAEAAARPVIVEEGRFASPSGLALVGTVISSNEHIALVKLPDVSDIARIAEGQTVAGWTVEAILPDCVALRNGEAQVALMAGRQGARVQPRICVGSFASSAPNGPGLEPNSAASGVGPLIVVRRKVGLALAGWDSYIEEAATRFGMPAQWVREVMRLESGGRAFLDGAPIRSPAGAIGLMQVMPQTFDELRLRYRLGRDPDEPRNNILAGVAYMREMYDRFGAPGFLGAYNAGPQRMNEYLTNNRALPEETSRYMAEAGPSVAAGNRARAKSPE